MYFDCASILQNIVLNCNQCLCSVCLNNKYKIPAKNSNLNFTVSHFPLTLHFLCVLKTAHTCCTSFLSDELLVASSQDGCVRSLVRLVTSAMQILDEPPVTQRHTVYQKLFFFFKCAPLCIFSPRSRSHSGYLSASVTLNCFRVHQDASCFLTWRFHSPIF